MSNRKPSSEFIDTVFVTHGDQLAADDRRPILLWTLKSLLGVSLNQIADELGVSRVQVSRYWRGKRQMPLAREAVLLDMLREAIVGARLALVMGKGHLKRDKSKPPVGLKEGIAALEAKILVAERILSSESGMPLREDRHLKEIWRKRLSNFEGTPDSYDTPKVLAELTEHYQDLVTIREGEER